LRIKHRSSKAVALVLLVFQLVLGFQFQAVQAVASPMAMQMSMSKQLQASADLHASAHVHAMLRMPTSTSAAIDDDASVQPDCPAHSMPHDCCHASACQCHCVYTPGVIDLPILSNIATSVAVTSLAATQFVAPHIDEFLRPPIA
jgi:hypothetical protein